MSRDKDSAKKEYIGKWLTKANHDLIIARNERNVDSDEIMTDGVCFHCQQSVEKDLKAFLVMHDVDFERIHNLEYLAKLCEKIDGEFSSLNFGNLTNYGVAVRYPDDFFMPSLEEADTCIRIAVQVKQFVVEKLDV